MSVWKGIDRYAFERNTQELERIDPSQKVVARTPREGPPNLETNALPPRVESQLAEDFAFLAAWVNTPSCVTAASVTVQNNESSVEINLAANEGVWSTVRHAFRLIATTLEQCALRSECPYRISSCVITFAQQYRGRMQRQDASM